MFLWCHLVDTTHLSLCPCALRVLLLVCPLPRIGGIYKAYPHCVDYFFGCAARFHFRPLECGLPPLLRVPCASVRSLYSSGGAWPEVSGRLRSQLPWLAFVLIEAHSQHGAFAGTVDGAFAKTVDGMIDQWNSR